MNYTRDRFDRQRFAASAAHEFDSGALPVRRRREDIHTAAERRLTELIGAAVGTELPAASRNDQVATDTRHWQAQTISRSSDG